MRSIQVVLLFFTAIILGACLKFFPTSGGGDQPVSSSDPPAPKVTANPGDYELGETAYIDSIDPVFLESFPLQVHAVINGNFPDGCTAIQRHEVIREGKIFLIKIFTQRPKGSFCTQVLVPFEYIVPLDVYGLQAGKYLVKAYNASSEFNFSQDNVLQGAEACTLYPDCGG